MEYFDIERELKNLINPQQLVKSLTVLSTILSS